MASNPMQRQARNFFLLGMFITLVIAAAIVALLYWQMNNLKKENEKYAAERMMVDVLSVDVNSGDVLTQDMFKQVYTLKSAVPSNYASASSLIGAFELYTKDGMRITSEYSDGKQHLYLNGDKTSEVFKEDASNSYYTQKNGDKTYIETTTAPVIAKVSAKANTIISQSLVARSDEIYSADVRKQEYNTIILPIDLISGEYVDVRLQLPSGQDYIVISKKMVEIPNVNGESMADTIQMNLAEEEILTLSSAIVEAYKIDGAKLYATKYVEAGLQEASSPTYVVNNEVYNLIRSDPNIVAKAKEALNARYNSNNLTGMRNQFINSELSQNGNEDGYKQKLQESITSTKEDRQKWLQTVTP